MNRGVRDSEYRGGQVLRTLHLVVVFLFSIVSPVARTQTFAHISIKLSTSTDPGTSRLRILPNGNLIAHKIRMFELLSLGYDVPYNPSPRLSAPPKLIYGQALDIEAKVPASLRLDTEDLPTQKRMIERLVRKLLIDRFGLVIQLRMERMPIYVLAATKGPLKLNRATVTASDCILDLSPEGCHDFAPGFGHPLNGRAVDMADLARYLENWTDLPVMERTQLNGLFTLHSQGWKPMRLPPPPPGTQGTGVEFATLPPLSAVLGDLGLQLLKLEESVPFYTVKRIHQPNAMD